MADNIKTYDAQEGIIMAWHSKTRVRESITLEDNWLRQWEITPVVLQKHGQDSKWRILECSDAPELEIGAAYNSETFRPVTNTEFLFLVADSIGGTAHKIVSVGSIRNRGRVFLSLQLSGHEKFQAAGREFSAYLNFGNGHDKSSVLWVNTSNTCTVCDNTFSANLFAVENVKKANSELAIRQRHTPQAMHRFPSITRLIDKAVGVQAEFAKAMDSLAATSCNPTTARQLFAGHVGRDITPELASSGLTRRGMEKVNRLGELFQFGRGNGGKSLADAVCAVTDFYTHESVRGGDMARQFASSEYETGAMLKREFFLTTRNPDKLLASARHGSALLSATKV